MLGGIEEKRETGEGDSLDDGELMVVSDEGRRNTLSLQRDTRL